MPDDARRARLNQAYADLKRAAEAVPAAVAAFKSVVVEQETAFNAAQSGEREHRAAAETDRAVQAQAAAVRKAEHAADESAQAAAAVEAELDRATAAFADERARLVAKLRDADDEIRQLRGELERLAAAKPEPPAGPKPARPRRAASMSAEAPAGAQTPASKAARAKKVATTPVEATARAPSQTKVPSPRKAAAPKPALRDTEPAEEIGTAVPAAAAPVETAIAEAFRAWCAAASPVVGKVAFFAEQVRQSVPEAAVAAVYRDANSQAHPVALRTAGGSSPVEYWLVAADGRHWLLPQPLGGPQFRELAPVFEGMATPATLAEVRPAEVRAVGDGFELVRPGRVA